MSEQHCHLYFRQGSSDKEYHAHLIPKADGFVVDFEYGRRGTKLTTGTKTSKGPVSLEKAQKIFDKLVTSKKQKGYTEDSSGSVYVGSDKEDKQTQIFPQLLNVIEDVEVEKLLINPNFWLQEKKDGVRMLLRKSNGKVEAINRKGQLVGFPAELEKSALANNRDFLVDGEAIGERLFVFDLLEVDGQDIRPLSYEMRHQRLLDLALVDAFVYIATVKSAQDKRRRMNELHVSGREGIVFKDKSASFSAGRPASGGSQLKYKFYATASVRIKKVNDGKRSVEMEVKDGRKWVAVGNCTIPINFDIPKAKQLAEIRYLYAYPQGSLYQPVFLGVRTDLDAKECVIDQLKYKPE